MLLEERRKIVDLLSRYEGLYRVLKICWTINCYNKNIVILLILIISYSTPEAHSGKIVIALSLFFDTWLPNLSFFFNAILVSWSNYRQNLTCASDVPFLTIFRSFLLKRYKNQIRNKRRANIFSCGSFNVREI